MEIGSGEGRRKAKGIEHRAWPSAIGIRNT
jgi:hypothetical protein